MSKLLKPYGQDAKANTVAKNQTPDKCRPSDMTVAGKTVTAIERLDAKQR